MTIAGLAFLSGCSGSNNSSSQSDPVSLNTQFTQSVSDNPIAAPEPSPASAPVSAGTSGGKTDGGDGYEFTQTISSSEEPGGSRVINVDCDRLTVDKSSGTPQVLATVSFISLFDAMNSPQYMAKLTPIQRGIITQAAQNRTVNQEQVEFMMTHVEGAHGVQPRDIQTTGERCKGLLLGMN